MGGLPERVRLISGADELLPRVDIIGELNIAVDFGKRYFHIGHCDWEAAKNNGGGSMGIASFPNFSLLYKIGRIFLQKWEIAI